MKRSAAERHGDMLCSNVVRRMNGKEKLCIIGTQMVITPPGRSIVINPSVCLSVCPRAYLSTAGPIVTKFFVQISCTWSWLGPLWRVATCDTLCTSGFMDDVTFSRNGPYGDSGVAIPGRSLMSINALLCMWFDYITLFTETKITL